jgi:hypothetical protein
MPNFIPGLELNRRFYAECVRPLLDRHFPGLPHAAALIGYGSEIIGFDTEMSTDHAWSPRLWLFLREADISQAEPIHDTLARRLPREFLGFPVSTVPVAEEPGVFWMNPSPEGLIQHQVKASTLRDFVQNTLNWDLTQPFAPADWLSISSQILLEMTAGAVYHDGTGELTALRTQLAWYPPEVWLYLLACGWSRIGQEEHLMPRAGFVGDELGSALIGARLARDIMSLCFLMEKRYAPYPKWFGSAFQRLTCAPAFTPLLRRAQLAETWRERESALCEAYTLLAQKHNALNLTDPLDEQVSNFHGRPFRVIHAERFCAALVDKIRDPEVKRIAALGLIGNLDQFSDNTDLRSEVRWRPGVRGLYGAV